MSKTDLLHYDIIMELMCYLTIDLNKIAIKHNVGIDYFTPYLEKLQIFIDDKILTIENNILTIDKEAKQIVRIICSYFDKYFIKRTANHSQSV